MEFEDTRTVPNTPAIQIVGLLGIPEVGAGTRLGLLIARAAARQSTLLASGDVLVVTQKIVSKAEGNLVKLDSVTPSLFASQIAGTTGRDPRLVELVLRESRSIVRMDQTRGILITETKHGFVCANAGIDLSNVPGDDVVSLLPEAPDESARLIRKDIRQETGEDVAVVISDTFGRPWREGQTNFAIGIAGMEPLKDYRGEEDAVGKPLKTTIIAEADELAAAAELVMAKSAKVPAAIIKGHTYQAGNGSSVSLIRNRSLDLFR